MTRPKHIKSENQIYFVTTNSYYRVPVFQNPQIAKIVIDAVYFLRSKVRLKLYGFVLMPDHLHIVVSLPEGEDLSKVMHSLKSFTAKEIIKKGGARCPASKMEDGRLVHKKVWQSGYWDYGIRGEKDILVRIKYLLENPVRKGLVESADLYPFSSAQDEYEVDEI